MCGNRPRLVARELEARWNAALAEIQHLEQDYAQARQRQLSPLTEADRTLIRQLLTDLPQLWQAETTMPAERKRLLRCLIRDVTLDSASEPGQIAAHVHWQTGATTTLHVRRPRSCDHAETDGAILERMRVLAADHDDGQIADQLNAEHFRTRQGKAWSYRRVHAVRVRHHIPSGCPIVPHGDAARGDGLVPLQTAARLCGVTRGAITDWVHKGILEKHQLSGQNPLWVRVNAENLQRLQATEPQPGYQRLQQVAETLGITEATLWEDVRSERRAIRRMRRGQRWEWQVELSPPKFTAHRRASHWPPSRPTDCLSRPFGGAV